MKNQLVILLAAAALGIAAVSPVSAAGKASQSAKATAADSKVIIPVEGLSCASCSFAVRRALKKMDGVKSIERGPNEDEALVTYDASKVKPEQFVEAINGLGFKAGTPVKG
jgi:P-type Cu+ transporter